MKRLLHFFPTISQLGGVEAVLRLHALHDATASGWESAVLIACEADDVCRRYGASGLGIRGWNNMMDLRKRFLHFYDLFKPDVFVCHNLWSGRHLLPYMPHCLKVTMLHTASDESKIALANCASFLNGAIAPSSQIASDVRKITGNRFEVASVDIPINPPQPPTRNRSRGHPFVIGYCGRLVVEQKRCDRLVELIEETLKLSPDIRFELMGDGSYEPDLLRRFGKNNRVTLLGRKSGGDYWSHLQAWDAIVFTSEYEGMPIVLLEALSQGVIPVYPRINSGGDAYAEQVDPSLLYEKEDVGQAGMKLVSLSQLDETTFAAMRARAINLTLKHRAEAYLKSFFGYLERTLAGTENVGSVEGSASRGCPADLIPFYFLQHQMPRWVY